ncbi:hypothetical protein BH10CYA1_BH10CYA1_01030 [soil metagenome]
MRLCETVFCLLPATRLRALAVFLILLLLPLPANAEPDQRLDGSSLNQLTARAVDKELELMQMSTNLKLQTAPLNQWRERRWFAYSIINQILTVVGTYINGCTRIQYRNHTSDAPKNLFVNSSWLRIIAYAITVAGCVAETANDLRIQRSENKAGLNLRAYVHFVVK